MKEIMDKLTRRKEYLEKILRTADRNLQKSPPGTLRINVGRRNRTGEKNSNYYYYHRRTPEDRFGIYLPRKSSKLAKALAQKDYEQRVFQSAAQEIDLIDNCLNLLKKLRHPTVEEVFESLSKPRQDLVLPMISTDEMYVDAWRNVPYERDWRSDEEHEYYTERGEQVRSKSELIIAGILDSEGIPYRYEYPIYLKGLGTVRPDFMILDVLHRKEIIWEHLGKMDDPGYAEKNVRKISAYIRTGIFPGDRLLLTYETDNNPLNTKDVRAALHHILQRDPG